MRFLDLCDKEVVSAEECRFIGHVRDLEFDPVCGNICAIIVPGPGKYMGFLCRDYENVCKTYVFKNRTTVKFARASRIA